MDVLMISHSDDGGAGIAARRLQTGLRALNVDSQMLVRRQTSADRAVFQTQPRAGKLTDRARLVLDKLPLLRYPEYDGTPFSSQWVPDGLARTIENVRSDLIHLHWIGHGCLHPKTLSRLKSPIVWTLHDVWPFTGGCHVNLGCTRFEEQCGACPRLGSRHETDLSRAVWHRKHRAWHSLNLTLVAPSTWLARRALRSTLLGDKRVEVIPNGLDTQLFRPTERRLARSRLDLPSDRKLILFAVASGRRVAHKGFELLESALEHLSDLQTPNGHVDLVLAGPTAAKAPVRSGFQTHSLGPIREEETMATLYAAVDSTVVPSRQENLPQVAIESLACGTPVVAFNATGIPEVVDHRQNGYLARPFDPEDLAAGIHWVLEDPDRHRRLCGAARSKALERFDLTGQAKAYHELFKELLGRKRADPAC